MPDDKILVCSECGLNFVFSAKEQEVHVRMGYSHEPKRCPPCRAEAKKRRLAPGTSHITLCVSCGVEVALPYVPTPGRSVLCDACKAAR